MLKVTSTEKAPAAIGPYSQAIEFNNILFTSGQIPLDPATGEIVGTTIEEPGRTGYEEPRRYPGSKRHRLHKCDQDYLLPGRDG